MSANENPNPNPTGGDLVITRVFDAPRELVWRAWTDPEYFQRWWGPKDFTSPVCRMDLRVGGKYLWCMRSSDGKDYYTTGVFKEIVKPERIVYTDCFADQDGNVVSAEHYGLPPGFPLESYVYVTLVEEAGQTKVTLRHVGLPTGDMFDMTGHGWNESFDKLAISLEKSK